MASSAITGVAFGAALAASGVYQPSVILGQLKWENYHMLQAFLTATAASALITTTTQKLGYAQFSPRSYADRGWFAPYDGNILGGLALGAGMALSGACPGTVLAQTALNIRSGYYALGGGLLGGTFWAAVLRPSVAARKKKAAASTGSADGRPQTQPALPTTIQALFGVSRTAALVGLEVAFAAVVGGSVALFGSGPDAKISPVLGGLLIGLAQLFSVLVRRSLLGVSTVYEDAGDWLLYVTSDDAKKARPGIHSILFSLGLVAGVRALVTALPYLGVSPSSAAAVQGISPAAAVLGGFIMALGARVAGGCTSGHGISGMSLLSLSSFITMAAAFAGGGAVALLL